MDDLTAHEHQNGLYLTPEGFKALHDELDHLTVVKRPEIAERIRESLQHGEFSEDNSELDEVKFEQAMVENRIAELKTIFGTAQMLDKTTIPVDYVGIGSVVKIEDRDFPDEFEVRIVASIEADPSRDLVSMESPLGSALMGRKQGDYVEFYAPEGKKNYTILDISR